VWEVAADAPWSFLIGGVVGFLAGQTFQLRRRDGDQHDVTLPPTRRQRRRRP